MRDMGSPGRHEAADAPRRSGAAEAFRDAISSLEGPLLDALAETAARLCDTPMALVGFIDHGDLRLASRRGIAKAAFPLEQSFCRYTLSRARVLVVPDARKDSRFVQHPWVAGDPHIRFYAGVPLITAAGNAIGTLAVLDHKPRQIERSKTKTLEALGSQLVQQLALGRQLAELTQAVSETEDIDLLFRMSVDMLCVAGFDGFFKKLSPSFARTLGWTLEELYAKPYVDFVHPDDRASTDAEASKIASGVDTLHFENRYECKDGSFKWLSWTARPFVEKELMYSVARDITEQKLAEEELKRYARKLEEVRRVQAQNEEDLIKLVDELEEARRRSDEAAVAKSQFLANMSHEIRTPLNVILGMTELTLDSQLNEDQQEHLDTVRESAHSLLGLLNEILDLSKIEAGRLELATLPFDLRETVESTMKVLALRAHQKGLELACRIHPGVETDVIGDPGRLRQVLVNLVGNAIKFTEKGDVVLTVESKEETRDELRVHFSIRDTGIGIPPEKRDQIFESFTQVDSSTARKYGGTGLGLAIAAQLVELMGGKLRVDSQVGTGSTFQFTARFGRQPERDTISPDLTGHRVLLVEDNETTREILEEMLHDWKAEVVSVSAAEAALPALQSGAGDEHPFTSLLIDAQRSSMNGFELAHEIVQRRFPSRVSVILLVAASQRSEVARLRQAYTTYLTKPVRRADLFEALVRGSRRRPAADQSLSTRRRAGKKGLKLRVLLAEDNRMNQELAVELLVRRGHSVELASNGNEVLTAIDKQQDPPFDVVLMDVQMPEMGGLEATAAVRQREKLTGGHIPIVAITAHAMLEDRKRCLEAGMDGYISKPFQSQELFETIESLARPRTLPLRESPIDEPSLLEKLDHDRDLLRRLVSVFLDDAPRLIGEIRAALDRNDLSAVAATAHTLKGAIGNFSTDDAFEEARQLEMFAHDGDLTATRRALSDLEAAFSDLLSALERLDEHDRLSSEGVEESSPTDSR